MSHSADDKLSAKSPPSSCLASPLETPLSLAPSETLANVNTLLDFLVLPVFFLPCKNTHHAGCQEASAM